MIKTVGTDLERYYRLHAYIYDISRWSFLFGRNRILQEVAAIKSPENICEIGCGTGKNIISMCRRFPEADMTGIDLSDEMLAIARKKTNRMPSNISFIHGAYERPIAPNPPFDMMLFSYSLSMIHEGTEDILVAAKEDLAPGGIVAVVDFHASHYPLFQQWMEMNHVKMEKHLIPMLSRVFKPIKVEVKSAYGGIWEWFMFIGVKS